MGDPGALRAAIDAYEGESKGAASLPVFQPLFKSGSDGAADLHGAFDPDLILGSGQSPSFLDLRGFIKGSDVAGTRFDIALNDRGIHAVMRLDRKAGRSDIAPPPRAGESFKLAAFLHDGFDYAALLRAKDLQFLDATLLAGAGAYVQGLSGGLGAQIGRAFIGRALKELGPEMMIANKPDGTVLIAAEVRDEKRSGKPPNRF
ncbi:MAG: hypothetical protein M5R36_13520 [Deltaproteobacteria bacterium]|nr:hypothetical protein [Deltaproteobacteria bacterium]